MTAFKDVLGMTISGSMAGDHHDSGSLALLPGAWLQADGEQ
jgi:hypothetical protein